MLIVSSLVSDSTAAFASASRLSRAIPKMALEATGNWLPATSLTHGRHDHTATLLADGRVLVVGGLQERVPGSPGLASVEIYDPVTDMWKITDSLGDGRAAHTATLLPDGTVLVAGGRASYAGPALASAEIYDPISETWSTLRPLSVARRGHSATRLLDGRVLVVGGRFGTGESDVHRSTEIYDPVSGSWSPTGSLSTPREGHSATLLPDGHVLVVNGYYRTWLASAEVYDPVSGTWSEIMAPLTCHGVAHTATLMSDGTVLIVGGACGGGTPGIRAEAEIYVPATSAWMAATPLPAVREAHSATLLPDGTILIAGGDDGAPPRYDSAWIYDPADGGWSPTGSLAIGRRNHTATILDDGTVLVIGGWGDTTTYLDSAERYYWKVASTPTPTSTPTYTPMPPTHTPPPPTLTQSPVPPTYTPLPSTPTHAFMPPTPTPIPPTLTHTPSPPTNLPVSGGNIGPLSRAVFVSIICLVAIIGIAATAAGTILHFRNTRET